MRISRVFYGWWVVGASLTCLVVGIPIVSYTFGNFVKPLHEAFQWSRGQMSLGPSLALLGVTFGQPFLGRLTDRFGARVVILPCAVGFGASWMALHSLTASLWHFYLLYFLLGLFGGGVGPVPFAAILSRWFEKMRGLALGLATVGLSLGGFIMTPLAQHLIATRGWREAYALIGVLVWVIVLPVAGLALRERPETYGLLPDGERPRTDTMEPEGRASLSGLAFAQAWRTPNFWCLCAAFFLLSIALHGFLIHLIPLLTDRGVSGQKAAFFLSLLAASSIVGRAVSGYAADKAQAALAMGSKYIALGSFLCATAGILFLWQSQSEAGVYVFALLFGLSTGAEVDLFPYMVSRCFGLKAFAEIYGYTLSAFG
ncbi:MAG TPA: MFS transporter, partial [Candidatus Binatia bacterium]|nr:MFS transporter [Candidatus Binatia bacterium]